MMIGECEDYTFVQNIANEKHALFDQDIELKGIIIITIDPSTRIALKVVKYP